MGHLARSCSQKKEDDPSLFTGDKETATESETFFSGMALGDLNVETVLVKQEELSLCDSNIDELGNIGDEIVCAEQEELFLHDSNIDELGDLNNEAVFAEQEEMFLPDSNIDEKEGTFLSDSNVDVKKETFLCYTNIEKKEETFLRSTTLEEKDESSLHYQHVSSEDRREIVPFSGSDSRAVCPQKYFAGFAYRGSLVNADIFYLGSL